MSWYSKDHLRKAWRYAKKDAKDSFVFDVLDYADITYNIEKVVSTLSSQIARNQYHPSPLLQIGVPKSEYSSRPGTALAMIDLIVLYAIAQQLAPALDPQLSDSVYAYRLNPRGHESDDYLFKKRELAAEESTRLTAEQNGQTEEESEAEFPYDWFFNWKRFFEHAKVATASHAYVAVTDITAYFEDISLDILRDRIIERAPETRELVEKLFELLEFWDWNKKRPLPRRIGLPQGNDVSSFLSNLYLVDLDKELLQIVHGDTSKYSRYVDDIRIFTSDREQARRALVALEKVLRKLNLNVQSQKTKIIPTTELQNLEDEIWLEKMDSDHPDKLQNAICFLDEIFDGDIEKWSRPYCRCLSVLREAGDSRAVDVALALYLKEPSNKILTKNFSYLKQFVTDRHYSSRIVDRLKLDVFTFFYHRAFLYRLAAYSRDYSQDLLESAMADSTSADCHWFVRMSALFCLNTFPLGRQELAPIRQIIDVETDPQILRAAFVVLCQHSGEELKWVLNRISTLNIPYQVYLRRYLFQMFQPEEGAVRKFGISSASVNAPTFIQSLHKFDLLKAGSETSHRAAFRNALEPKIKDCEGRNWPRLKVRLEHVKELFILRP